MLREMVRRSHTFSELRGGGDDDCDAGDAAVLPEDGAALRRRAGGVEEDGRATTRIGAERRAEETEGQRRQAALRVLRYLRVVLRRFHLCGRGRSPAAAEAVAAFFALLAAFADLMASW
eukprot:CAMPEP_0118899826 /NCGR_PEP_ID=MMETSP1166-20130328/6220_1 /TAXON_ID=1104430 /ORGANISM="Chrysoreinhardia sp, Strain CCMP3193" /LENGTH=118 /DNA_ID=CAMNT_0006838957 /DNA_START=161 /DNA_END=517 /DNA_ORIENTATION=+